MNLAERTKMTLKEAGMKNYLLFAPNSNIANIASQINAQTHDYHIDIELCTEKEEVIKKATSLPPEKYDLIIARGLIVNYVKSATSLPVVSMRMTSQEMMALIHQAVNRFDRNHIKIGIIGSKELFPDISKLNSFFNATITLFYITAPDEVRTCVDRAQNDQYDIILGGLSACQYAESIQMPSLTFEGSEDSLLEALRVARQISYASEIEKKNRAEISVLLDYSINGIIRIDSNGHMINMNRIARETLHYPFDSTSHQHISALSNNISPSLLHQVLDLGMSIHSLFLTIGEHDFLCNFIPLTANQVSDGAILSLQETKTILNASSIIKRDSHQADPQAKFSFQNFICVSETMQQIIRNAKIMSQADSPVFIYGENGTEREQLAECIHLESTRCNGPFITFDCKGYRAEEQRKLLRGFLGNDKNADYISPFSFADKGTLLIKNIDHLTSDNQEFLLHFLTAKTVLDPEIHRLYTYDVRIIATAASNLRSQLEQEEFNSELFYLLSGMSLHLPPLRQRKEDVRAYIHSYIRHYSNLHSRLNTLSADSEKILVQYPWPGNLTQLSHFCEHLVLFSNRKIISEDFVSSELINAFPPIKQETASDSDSDRFWPNEEARHLAELLKKYNGNKNQIANMLGISRSTLWRKLKRYHLQ